MLWQLVGPAGSPAAARRAVLQPGKPSHGLAGHASARALQQQQQQPLSTALSNGVCGAHQVVMITCARPSDAPRVARAADGCSVRRCTPHRREHTVLAGAMRWMYRRAVLIHDAVGGPQHDQGGRHRAMLQGQRLPPVARPAGPSSTLLSIRGPLRAASTACVGAAGRQTC